MKTKWIRKAIKGISLTSALFVFQACYGTPQDWVRDRLISGTVKSLTSGLAIQGIKVTFVDDGQYMFTDEKGYFTMYTRWLENMRISFEDVDSTQNGLFSPRDTILTDMGNNVILDIKLEGE